MARNTITPALVLSLQPLGESNSSVRLLTKSDGIVYATLYGGAKSRLRSLVSPWNSGTAYISTPPRSRNGKISDFDVQNYHLSFRESLFKAWAAALAAEVAIKTKCAGSPERCWPLVSGFLDGLELCADDSQASAGLLRFLWRFLDLLGVQPDAAACGRCGRPFLTGKNPGNPLSWEEAGAAYSPAENSFLCAGCLSEQSGFFLNADAVRYLAAVSALPPAQARLFGLAQESAEQLKRLTFHLVEAACGMRLNALETGTGIL
ncbi:MAG: DNA repair protein RecO C-terminal domain-containing protein [Treponemataceae bacterium]|nr:DNA repair protein RecO C-terminal domain-containing protein [Treponemataceae bacterium]